LKVNDAVVSYYEGKDRFIGEVLSKLDGKTLLLVISDHGFTSFERSVSMNNWLVENGYMKLTKEIKDGDDGVLFKYVDWSQTKAYSLGFNSIYINLKGREGKGIVEPAEREQVVKEIVAGLDGLTDAKYGKKPVSRAYRREEVYTGDYVKDAPDIIVGFNPGYRMAWQTAIGGFSSQTLEDNTKKWNGDHLVDPNFVPGVLFSNVKIKRTNVSQMDVAPTVLEAVGVKLPADMDGVSLI
jgi:predicted AlkP superfamily phosphohydrolase/phosphomutase